MALYICFSAFVKLMLDDFMYMYTKDPYAVFIDHCAFVDKDPPRETVQTNDDL